jgi:uncharacterized Rmd1/YagE family protein
MSIRSIREQFRKIKKNLSMPDAGFESDYYTYHNKKTHKKLSFKNLIIVNEEEDSVHKYYKRIMCLAIGYDFYLQNVMNELNTIMPLESAESGNKNVLVWTGKDEKTLFLFEYGVIVLWAFDENEERQIANIFARNCKVPIVKDVSKILDERIFFFNKGENFEIVNRNKITIESYKLTEKLAISYALAQEAILNHYEDEVDDTIEETKHIPIALRDKGEINLDTKEISRYIGMIFNKRSAVNLNSGVLDTPDIQDSELEGVYLTVRFHLEMNKRIDILNKRMKLLKELYDVLNSEVKTQGKFRLEWIVVYLICIEIFIAVFWKILVKDILKLF